MRVVALPAPAWRAAVVGARTRGRAASGAAGPLRWLVALCVLVAPGSARAQSVEPAEQSAEQVLRNLVTKHGVGLILDDDAREVLARRRLVFAPPSDLDVVAAIEVLLRTSGLDFERLPPDGAADETTFAVHRPRAVPSGRRVAVVDMSAVFDAHPGRAALEAKLDAERLQIRDALEAELSRIREKRMQLNLLADPTERERVRAEVRAAVRALEERTAAEERRQQERFDRATEALLVEAEAAVAAVAEREGAAVVLSSQTDAAVGPRTSRVVWAAPGVDITRPVVDELRRRAARTSEDGRRPR